MGITYWFSPVLAGIVLGVGLITTLTAPRTAAVDEAEVKETWISAVQRRYPESLPEGDGLTFRRDMWWFRIAPSKESSLEDWGTTPIVLSVPVSEAIPFCFVVQPRNRVRSENPLVRNTHLPASFEYELQTMPVDSAPRLEAATNAPALFKKLLASGLEEFLETEFRPSQWLVQQVVFDGSRILIEAESASPLQTTPELLETLFTIAEGGVVSVAGFIAKEELVAAVRRMS